jgi:uncharacterized protein YhdP
MSLGTVSPRTLTTRLERPRRATVLRDVIDAANTRRDGRLPTDVAGVAETFPEPFDLLAALQLRWHTRLAGAVEAALADQPMDLEHAVLCAWRRTARDLVGVRLVLDRHAEQPLDDTTAAALARARRKDWTLLAVMAGQAAVNDQQAAEVGRVLELLARASFDPAARPRHRGVPARRRARVSRGTLRGRLGRAREHVAA